MRGNRDLQLAVRAAFVCALLAVAIPVPVLSLLAVAPLLFFLPGYAIVCAAFARQSIDPARLLVLSVGLSLAVLALLPLLLALLPGGISTGWWAVGLLLVVLAAARGAALGRARPARAAFPRLGVRVGVAEAGLLALGAIAAIAAVALIYTPLPASNAIGYSQLWIEPLPERDRPTVKVGVGSREQEETGYRLEFRVGGREDPFAFEQLSLRPGEEETVIVPVPDRISR
jgi:uncharacterized membrane protein